MRPRHKTAENGDARLDAVPQAGASMRPRHKTAENALEPAGRGGWPGQLQ